MASVSIGELEFVPQRSRATRSTHAFVRMVGAPIVLGSRHTEVRPGSYRIQVAWGSRPVEFSLKLAKERARRNQTRLDERTLNAPSKQQKQQASECANKQNTQAH